MVKLVNRAKMTTSTTGTGALSLGSASPNFQTFASAGVVDGELVRYVIEEGSEFEIGTGTYTATGTTLSRTLTESSTGSLLSLTGGAAVFITAASSDIQQPPSEGSFADGDKTKLDAIGSGTVAVYASDGTSGQVLSTNGSGVLSFVDAGSGTSRAEVAAFANLLG